MVSKRAAYEAFIEALKGISGSPYWTNLEGRVYTRYVEPTAEMTKPYVCAPLVLEEEEANIEETHAEPRWSVRVTFFCEDNIDSDPLNTSAVGPCCDWSDDIKAMVMRDPYLGHTVTDLSLGRINTLAGGDDLDYAEVSVEVEFMQLAGENDLGQA